MRERRDVVVDGAEICSWFPHRVSTASWIGKEELIRIEEDAIRGFFGEEICSTDFEEELEGVEQIFGRGRRVGSIEEINEHPNGTVCGESIDLFDHIAEPRFRRIRSEEFFVDEREDFFWIRRLLIFRVDGFDQETKKKKSGGGIIDKSLVQRRMMHGRRASFVVRGQAASFGTKCVVQDFLNHFHGHDVEERF